MVLSRIIGIFIRLVILSKMMFFVLLLRFNLLSLADFTIWLFNISNLNFMKYTILGLIKIFKFENKIKGITTSND
jgi:hypothetical protein